ncbi:hypothetical protein ACI01nite_14310 [Acetobacter cibinongensis]|uniref:Uncharacterized protein n=1 Tax=Acetobacter cibinongensis TaxID=146475 RepID=A0A0D6N5G2_9PROT|nr:hypothetical protein [Acetobacter cibinongensis]GAN60798.1 hypothetical protein Abci_016_144 [Acetobacter cibinongensis]GBQ12206.1 hypothetical protein AA0482_0183 [Acetobacter cibinongensis NRIC 0482]GEL58829.1 hypothetical protein ACI01nite_14310 [Acetobacter cibinongensis]
MISSKDILRFQKIDQTKAVPLNSESKDDSRGAMSFTVFIDGDGDGARIE